MLLHFFPSRFQYFSRKWRESLDSGSQPLRRKIFSSIFICVAKKCLHSVDSKCYKSCWQQRLLSSFQALQQKKGWKTLINTTISSFIISSFYSLGRSIHSLLISLNTISQCLSPLNFRPGNNALHLHFIYFTEVFLSQSIKCDPLMHNTCWWIELEAEKTQQDII
jgi:hypothetical protein